MNYSAGVEYGYSLPVAYRLNIDFSIAVGYWGGTHDEYKPVDNCYVWQSTKEQHWFGPTKAEVSLVWLIGRGNFNEGRGRRTMKSRIQIMVCGLLSMILFRASIRTCATIIRMWLS